MTSESEVTTPLRRPVRYRASCDQCQDIKLRCSQQKPTCTRCARKGLDCLYSPLRRIGRPRKTPRANEPKQRSLLNALRLPVSSPLRSEALLSAHASDAGLASGLSNASTSTGLDTSTFTTPECNLGSWNFNHTGIRMRGQGSVPQGSDHQATGMDHEDLGLAINASSIPYLQSTKVSAVTAVTTNTHETSADNSVTNETLTMTKINMTVPSLTGKSCHLAILTRTAALEQCLATMTSLNAAPIDIILEAERDFRSLWHDHQLHRRHDQQSTFCDRLPVCSLTLALFAERIITSLEQTFHQAAETASAIAIPIAAPDDCDDGTPSTSSTPTGTNASMRRLDRSFRGLLDLPCVFPLPASNLDIRIGVETGLGYDFIADGRVKARAIRRILQRRVDKLLGILEVEVDYITIAAIEKTTMTDAGSWTGGDAQGTESEMDTSEAAQRSSGFLPTTASPLDWGGSGSVMVEAATALLRDLVRRTEALQGAMVLMG